MSKKKVTKSGWRLSTKKLRGHKPEPRAVLDEVDNQARDVRGEAYVEFLDTLITDLEMRKDATEQEIEDAQNED